MFVADLTGDGKWFVVQSSHFCETENNFRIQEQHRFMVYGKPSFVDTILRQHQGFSGEKNHPVKSLSLHTTK